MADRHGILQNVIYTKACQVVGFQNEDGSEGVALVFERIDGGEISLPMSPRDAEAISGIIDVVLSRSFKNDLVMN